MRCGRDPLYQGPGDRPFSRQRILVVERCLIAAERVLVAPLMIEILAELDQIVVDQELAGVIQLPRARV